MDFAAVGALNTAFADLVRFKRGPAEIEAGVDHSTRIRALDHYPRHGTLPCTGCPETNTLAARAEIEEENLFKGGPGSTVPSRRVMSTKQQSISLNEIPLNEPFALQRCVSQPT